LPRRQRDAALTFIVNLYTGTRSFLLPITKIPNNVMNVRYVTTNLRHHVSPIVLSSARDWRFL
jgi:hypothetical protein